MLTIIKMLNNDQVSSAVWFFIGVFIMVVSLPYELGGLHAPKTGFLPFVTGAAACILSLIGFVTATMKRKQGEKWKRVLKGFLWEKPLITMGALVAYAGVLNTLGFIITTALLVAFLLRAIIPQKWSVVISGAVLTPFIAYLVFQVCLKTQLPMGFLGF
jgi:multisubunit Na+/H+ antiporter MnhB subunit